MTGKLIDTHTQGQQLSMPLNARNALWQLHQAGVRYCIGAGYALNRNNTHDIDLSIHPDDYDLVKSVLPDAREYFYAPAQLKKMILFLTPLPLDMYFGCVLPQFAYGNVATRLDENGFFVWTPDAVRQYYTILASNGSMKAKEKLQQI